MTEYRMKKKYRAEVVSYLNIIHTWASFAREKGLGIGEPKALEDIERWTTDAANLLKEMDNLDDRHAVLVKTCDDLMAELKERAGIVLCKDLPFIQLHGASKEGDEYVSRGPVCVNPGRISVFYDHTIMADDGIKIRVMESFEEIAALINGKGERKE